MSTSSKKITLKSSDEETFVVDEVVARESQLIKNMIEYGYDCMDRAIPIPNVTSKTLAKVIEYCKKHAEVSKTEGNNTAAVCQELKAWDASFIKVDQSTLFYLTLAANLLNIKGLFELTCQTFADMMKGSRTLEEIKKAFDLENKFTSKKELGLFLLGS